MRKVETAVALRVLLTGRIRVAQVAVAEEIPRHDSFTVTADSEAFLDFQ